MGKLEEASSILQELGFGSKPTKVAQLTLLALANIGLEDSWSTASAPLLTVHLHIMKFAHDKYGVLYATNSRESFRKEALRPMVHCGLIVRNADDPSRPTNAQDNNYQLTETALAAIRRFGTASWETYRDKHLERTGLSSKITDQRRKRGGYEVALPGGTVVLLTGGSHNLLLAEIIESMLPAFFPRSLVLYLGDTAKKDLWTDTDALKQVGLTISTQDKVPDVILLDAEANTLILVEAIDSGGEINDQRLAELEEFSSGVSARKLFISAFLSFKKFKTYIDRIAWETDVWIAEKPEHLVHFNGQDYLRPKN